MGVARPSLAANKLPFEVRTPVLVRQFSDMKRRSGNDKDKVDEFFGKKMTQEEKDAAARAQEQREEEERFEAEERAERRKADSARQQADFDDFLAGKKPQKKTEDMTIQELFRTYYEKAQEVDVKGKAGDHLNSAMKSLNGFSAKLDARRRAAKAQREKSETK